MTENKAGIPLFMKAGSGNVTDKTSLKLVVSKHLKSFKAALESRYFVGDAALYIFDTVKELDQEGQWFISKVPLNIGASKELVYSAPSRIMKAVQTGREAEASLGCFVLATNDTDTGRLNTAGLLKTYKSQQQVERGFRFQKSPDFLVSFLYLRKPERIEALLISAQPKNRSSLVP